MVAVVVGVAGCGIADTGVSAAGPPVSGGFTESSGRLLRVYFVTRQGTWPVSRPALDGDLLPQAMAALRAGPTAAERARGLGTELPATAQPFKATASGGRVELRLPWQVRELPAVAVSQLVCTAATAAGVTVVDVFEPRTDDTPWPVRCDPGGAAVPAEQEGAS
ncbi:hypothetical protein DP939_07820 [Spongiactinospora rosea]|uniref:GerMN domain-containing protein n=1 Tax=Spongiactinospora rosea TaxID=2248750 RepID=A0A366M3Y9_9ACTN|nr:hypothetical protein DP939_07820 [Spongiactinospora rosea]